MLFSDLQKISNDIKIIGKLPKKKIHYLSEHSHYVNENTLLVINQNKKYIFYIN